MWILAFIRVGQWSSIQVLSYGLLNHTPGNRHQGMVLA